MGIVLRCRLKVGTEGDEDVAAAQDRGGRAGDDEGRRRGGG